MQKKFDFDKLPSDYDLRTDIVKEDTIIDDKFECSHEDVFLENEDTEIEHWFLRYLNKKGYIKSTINNYVDWVKIVMENEKIVSWKELFSVIDTLCVKYDTGGEAEDFGKYGHRTVINSLKRFNEFSKQYYVQVWEHIRKK
ncbi:MAG: hypothetical protein NC310_07940 [Roseburia sp.]|nr:hypothetical protein [Anaeroplasma bactoclasticum]MCM1196978.1 hypothetical protein [Roseburia sp.]MCM1557848.1 hypothetical protein [Anaeroplasma bactoclasticum]